MTSSNRNPAESNSLTDDPTLEAVPKADLPRVLNALHKGYIWCLTAPGTSRYLARYPHYGVAKGTEPLYEEYLDNTPEI